MEDPALAQAERLYKGHSTRYWPAPEKRFTVRLAVGSLRYRTPNQRFEARTISFQPLDPADAQAYTTSDDAADCADDHHRPGGEFGIHK
ncbi:hypothetical protein FB556_0920 [Enteractinococcus coprophilus]|uniref:Uncharacterized protein n=1 Tax=Enteractinococcus coprophilus TaxID=1027633 RepID=A0A543APH2_9MICC|nr:hypothetical protein FB556_0920 [Enteractinococcus coprophilus]